MPVNYLECLLKLLVDYNIEYQYWSLPGTVTIMIVIQSANFSEGYTLIEILKRKCRIGGDKRGQN